MKEQPSYWSGIVDALALVAITIIILLAALLAGCAHRPTPPPKPVESTGCIYTLISVEVVDLDADVDPVHR